MDYPYDPIFCEECGCPVMYVDHYEPDGITEFGSHEPYYVCPNGCEDPTAERIETDTEFGRVLITQDNYQLSSII